MRKVRNSRQIDRQTDRQTDRKTERQTETETETETDRDRDRDYKVRKDIITLVNQWPIFIQERLPHFPVRKLL